MDENKLLERIRASAQDVQVPDCLKPEEIIKKMNASTFNLKGNNL